MNGLRSAQLGASGASKAAGCCEQQSGSAAAAALAAGIGQLGSRNRSVAAWLLRRQSERQLRVRPER
jgi:hypothetical protein